MSAGLIRCWAIGVALSAVGVSGAAEFRATSQPAGRVGTKASRSLATANGLLNRGMYDFAAEEYAALLGGGLSAEDERLARYGLAICKYRLGQLADAIEQLEKLEDVEDFAYSAEVLVMLGRARLALGDAEGALPALERVQRDYRHHDLAVDAAVAQVEALARLGRYEETVRWAGEFEQRWPASAHRPRVLYYRALAESSLGAYDAAIKRLEDVTASGEKPLSERAALLAAECLEHTERWRDAGERFDALVESDAVDVGRAARLGLARVRYREGQLAAALTALEGMPGEAVGDGLAGPALMLRGRIRFEQGKTGEARRDFEAARKAGKVADDEVGFWSAKCDAAEGDQAGAAALLEQVIKEHPDSALIAEASFDRARALLKEGKTAEALESFAAFRESFPEHALAADALLVMAVETHRAGDFEASEARCGEFRGRYADDPRMAEIEFLQGENAYLQERFDEALATFTTFLKRYPHDGQVNAARYRSGMAAYRLGRDDEAQAQLAELMKDDDAARAFPEALRVLGDIQVQGKAWEEAERYLTRYVAMGDDVAAADEGLFKLAVALQRQGKSAEALRLYDRLLASYAASPLHGQAFFERGQIRLAQGDVEGATADFAAVRDGGDEKLAAYAAYQLGSIAIGAGRSDEAAKRFEEAGAALPDADVRAEAEYRAAEALLAAGKFEEAADRLTRFVNGHAGHPLRNEANVNLAIALARLDRPEDALRRFENIGPDVAAGLDPHLRSRLWYEKAWAQRALGRTDEALQTYGLLLADRAGDGQLAAYAALEAAELHAGGGRNKEAMELLAPLCAGAPSAESAIPAEVRERAMYRLGLCRYETEDLAGCAALMEQLLAEFPESPKRVEASLYGAEALHQMGKDAAAVPYFERVIAEARDEDVRAAATVRLGEALAKLQRWEESEKALNDYLKAWPEGEQAFRARFGVGWARENAGRYDEAMAAYRQVIEGHEGPTAARAQFQIGECLFAQKKLDDAVRELLKVDILYAYPQWSAAALVEASKCLEQLNRVSEARRQLEAVVERFPDTEWASMAKARLPELTAPALPGHEAAMAQENNR